MIGEVVRVGLVPGGPGVLRYFGGAVLRGAEVRSRPVRAGSYPYDRLVRRPCGGGRARGGVRDHCVQARVNLSSHVQCDGPH
ncbi:hypothetical protein GCM10010329_23330 [Streptomyces spiroverticillatus]|uniref:Uncharacterized protein n=1 Tax=Streptomyces finlayi TaxID=67296 RepID=A0A918WUV6_9ACTN|nr:hypothetical protein GCM10010329_23330 [Streptomyces spiroverticillatus]GHC85205.1 hypothetical protein GCM10010334_15750 [Streptomyces finlayi]